MNSVIDQDHGLLREAAMAFAVRQSGVMRHRRLLNAAVRFERDMWKRMADLGWTGLMLPEEHGGLGLGVSHMAAVLEPLAAQLFPEPLSASVMASRAMALGDNLELQRLLLPQLARGDLVAALAWQDDESRIDPLQCAATARWSGHGWTLQGSKRFVVPGELSDGYVVSALEEGRLCLYWLPSGVPGLRTSQQDRADGSRMAVLQLDSVRIEPGHRIAGPDAGATALMRVICEGTVLLAVEALGVLDRALEITLEYLRLRKQFGKPIGSFQALQHRAVNMHIQRELSRAAVRHCLSVIERGGDAMALALAASRAKVRCCESALAITRECIQLHGAIGFTHECDIGLYLKRALVLSAWLGNPAAHRRRYGELALAPTEEATTSGNPHPRELPRDTDWNALDDESFRKQVRGFFETHYPAHLRHLDHHPSWEEIGGWFKVLSDKGWMAPSWPREFGGMGLTPSKLLIFIEERERWGVARGPDNGVNLIGPLLIRFGSPEQRARYLPPMLTGEERWCQGYSEPNSGSDLASLRTTAVLEGDEFVINGQKIWTSYGAVATHMFMLARTSHEGRKQDGISFLLLDLRTPGVTVRPIQNIAGHRHFCEVFFDGARTNRSNLVGELHRGWSVAKALLGFERLFSGSPKRPQLALGRLTTLARNRNLLADPVFRDRLTRLRLDVEDHAALYERFAGQVRSGEPLGQDVSMLKVWGTETFQRLSELMVEAAGNDGATEGAIQFGSEAINILGQFYDTFPSTIASGSNEIQRNILARNVLQLPG